jgi:hypothetical protein
MSPGKQREFFLQSSGSTPLNLSGFLLLTNKLTLTFPHNVPIHPSNPLVPNGPVDYLELYILDLDDGSTCSFPNANGVFLVTPSGFFTQQTATFSSSELSYLHMIVYVTEPSTVNCIVLDSSGVTFS